MAWGSYFVALAFIPLLGSPIAELAPMTLGVLFINISIGGTLTNFAAPPVLMVAAKWNWDTWHMRSAKGNGAPMPLWVSGLQLLFLAEVVAFAHHPAAFMVLLLFFLGFETAYPQHQDRLILREGLLVAFFLAGLVVLGGQQQQWCFEPLLLGMNANSVYFGATALTATPTTPR